MAPEPFISYTVIQKRCASVTKVGVAHAYRAFINTKFQVLMQINEVLLKQVASYLAKKLLTTHSTGSIGYYCMLLFIHGEKVSLFNVSIFIS